MSLTTILLVRNFDANNLYGWGYVTTSTYRPVRGLADRSRDYNEQVYIYFESRPSLSLRITRSSLYPLTRDKEDSIGDVVYCQEVSERLNLVSDAVPELVPNLRPRQDKLGCPLPQLIEGIYILGIRDEVDKDPHSDGVSGESTPQVIVHRFQRREA